LNRHGQNTLSAVSKEAASKLRITKPALSEIRATIIKDLKKRVSDLTDRQRPVDEMLVVSRVHGTAKPCRYEDWAKVFGRELSQLLQKAFYSYVELLTKTIVEHSRHRASNRPIKSRPIYEEALEFCQAFEKIEECGSWFVFARARVGKLKKQQLNPSGEARLDPAEWEAFLSALSTWRIVYDQGKFSNLEKQTDSIVTHFSFRGI
jgi:hypothetical protein